MIRHIVLLTWKDETSSAQIDAVSEGLGTMPDLVGGIVRYEFGSDLGLRAENADYVLVADFETEDDYHRYASHPDHLEVIERTIKPIVSGANRVQYEV
jgi:hypothetical protein